MTRVLLLCGLIVPFVTSALAVFAATTIPGYSHISGTYSDLAAQGTPQPAIMGSGLFLTGLLTIAAGFGLVRVLPGRHRFLFLMILMSGIAISVTGVAQDYPRGQGGTDNPEAYVHNAAVGVAIMSIVIGMLLSLRIFQSLPQWRFLRGLTIGCLVGVFASASALQFGSAEIDGLAERTLSGFAYLWLVVVCARGLMTTGLVLPDWWMLSGRKRDEHSI